MDNQQQYTEEDNKSFVMKLHKRGRSFSQIKDALVSERNMDPKEAETLMYGVYKQTASHGGGAGCGINVRMATGVMFILVGAIIWLFTYAAAPNSGGTYVIPYGAMIFGAIQFFRGLADLL